MNDHQTINADYLGMPLELAAAETDNQDYFGHCARHDFHLQSCESCALLRYPPTAACPFCGHAAARWLPVEGRGTVHSYSEVTHAIQPAFREHLPYMVLLVDLDTQKGLPGPHDAIRVVGNLVTADGAFAPPDVLRSVGIGSRVRMVFTDVVDGLSLPQWTLDDDAPATTVWRYPESPSAQA